MYYLEPALDKIQRMHAGEQNLWLAEEKIIRLDGGFIDVELIALPLTYQGEPAVQVILSDITDRKEVLSPCGTI